MTEERPDMSNTISNLRVGSTEDRQPLTIVVNGKQAGAFAGESVATALLGLGLRTFRHMEDGTPRGLYCGMGVCFDCLVTVDGVENVRACMTPVTEGMVIDTGGSHE
jgi:sarcosine oxidase subunit alpha